MPSFWPSVADRDSLAEDAGVLCEAPHQGYCGRQLGGGRLLLLRLFQHYSVV
jgi:hypothetical protein